ALGVVVRDWLVVVAAGCGAPAADRAPAPSSGILVAPAPRAPIVGLGGTYGCAIRLDGTLARWDGDEPARIAAPPGTFEQLAVGDGHACAVRTDHTVACWGDNTSGEATPPPGTFTQLAVGDSVSCGIRSDRTIACWGHEDRT